jgi:hypothetical protein
VVAVAVETAVSAVPTAAAVVVAAAVAAVVVDAAATKPCKFPLCSETLFL